MTAAGAAKAAGVLGAGAGGVAAVVLSPLPLLVLGGVVLVILGPLAVVVLTATLSCHPIRQPNAVVVMDRLIAAVCAGTGGAPSTLPPPRLSSRPAHPAQASAPDLASSPHSSGFNSGE